MRCGCGGRRGIDRFYLVTLGSDDDRTGDFRDDQDPFVAEAKIT